MASIGFVPQGVAGKRLVFPQLYASNMLRVGGQVLALKEERRCRDKGGRKCGDAREGG